MDLNNLWIPSLLFFICCFQQSSHSHAFDITQMLNQFPDFSSFNNYISQAQLTAEINARQSITVLAVDNGGLGSLSGEGIDVIRTIISIHVLLDYFDAAKFRTMSGSTLTPTLFQTTGKASGQLGFVNISVSSGGSVLFGSGVQDSSPRASLVRTVLTQPYNISILQVSSLIYPKGVQVPSTPPPPTPPPPPPPPPPPTTTTSPPPSANTTSPPPSANTTSPPPSANATSPPPSANATSPPPSANATSPPPSANTTSPPPSSNTTSPPSPSPLTTTSPPSPSPVKATSPALASPKTAPSKSPKISPATASAPSPAVEGPSPMAADKAGSSSLRFGGGIILTLVAINTWWLTMG